jgi:hypothetical protein
VVRFCVPTGFKKELLSAADPVVTVSVTLTVWLRELVVPVILSVEVPPGVLPDVVTASLELPEPLTVEGAKDTDVPPGNPLTPKFTVPLKPLSGEIVTV